MTWVEGWRKRGGAPVVAAPLSGLEMKRSGFHAHDEAISKEEIASLRSQ